MDIAYRIAFARIPGIGARRFRLLEERFPDLKTAWHADLAHLTSAGLDEQTARRIVNARRRISPGRELETVRRLGITALSWHDPSYPRLLREIPDPPPVLFAKGELRPEDERAVAVVGTRGPTAYGREATAFLVRELARRGVTVVSGLARGIDATAHRSALEVGGRTVAVLASGLDYIYPAHHRQLAQEIAGNGALVGEHPPGVRPRPETFPRRNRIISGLALGVLVTEAPLQSGAMWTVRHALEQGRDVFCVPGSIFSPASRGTNALIQEGAKAVMTADDVLEELNLTTVARQVPLPVEQAPPPANEAEEAILRHLSHEPLHVDEVKRATGLPVAVVSGALAIMELKGLVKRVGALHYVRVGG